MDRETAKELFSFDPKELTDEQKEQYRYIYKKIISEIKQQEEKELYEAKYAMKLEREAEDAFYLAVTDDIFAPFDLDDDYAEHEKIDTDFNPDIEMDFFNLF